MTKVELHKKYPIGSKFKVIKTGVIKEVGAYGEGLLGPLIKVNSEDIMGFSSNQIEPVGNVQGLRMYFFVMYNLSGIQKGIQAGHAALEYYQTFGKTKEYQDFITHHKTFILLDGGGSEDMKQKAEDLTRFKVDYDGFFEPDLNNSLSAIAFIVPEEIYGMDSAFIDYAKANPEFMDWKTEFAMYLKGFRLASN